MSLLLKNALILDAGSLFNGKKADVYISKGRIADIGKSLAVDARRVVRQTNLMLSPGWVDTWADYRDPGNEQKETLAQGLKAAAAGGFSDVFIVPNTEPVISNASVLESVLRKGSQLAGPRLHVMGAVTKDAAGSTLAEMLEMKAKGAVAFSDGWNPVQNPGLLLKALEYIKPFKGVLQQLPVLKDLEGDGLMNESVSSLRLGMPGIPAMAETLMVHRDIELLRYTGSRLHISGVSTAAALKLIRNAKKEGLAISCSVTPYHLLYNETALEGYDSNFKVTPPLRAETDRKALIKGLEDGTVDCIATHHRPQDWDAKAKEFEYAGYGMNVQEVCWPMLLKAAPRVEMAQWVRLLAENPRKIFDLSRSTIDVGQPATITAFDAVTEWTFTTAGKQSRGINNPLLNQSLKGKVILF